jgi:hypothetical protein
MTLYYNQSLNLWSDNLASVPQQAQALRAKIRAWDNRGFAPAGWVAVTESSPVYDNSPLTGDKVRVLDEGGTTYSYMVGESRWNNAIDQSAQIETLRAEKIQQLHQWWDEHPGIEVVDGIVLPIQEIGRNTNTAALTLGLVTSADPIELVSIDDYTVSIAAADAPARLATFRAAYTPISRHWDNTHQALVAATTLAELQAIDLTYTPPE